MAEDIQAEAKPERKKKEKIIQTMGTRKRAIARATIKAGKGVVRINAKPLDLWEPSYARLRLREPIMLAEQVAGGVDIEVNVTGGGFWGQTDAARTAIANGLVEWSGDEQLRQNMMDYDRTLLVSDSRRTEPHKPSRSSAGPRRKKQQSKR